MEKSLTFLRSNKKFIFALLFSLIFASGMIILMANRLFDKAVAVEMSIVPEYDTAVEFTGMNVADGVDWAKGARYRSGKLAGRKVNQVRFLLPLRDMAVLHLKFFAEGGKLEIRSLKVSGANTLDFLQGQRIYAESLLCHEQSAEKIIVSSKKIDSAVIFCRNEAVKAARQIDNMFCCIVFILLLLLSFSVFYYFLQRLDENDFFTCKSFIILLFCCMLPLPASVINRNTVSEYENRTLAPFPGFISKDGLFNVRFGTQFEEFFKDHFRGRDRLLLLARKLETYVNLVKRKRPFNENIVAGDGGFYFLRKENSIRNYQNLDSFSIAEMQQYLQNLKRFDAWCRKHNAKFYYFIAPDKNRIYDEYLSFLPKVNPDSRSRAALWVKFIRENSSLNVFYPVDELKKHKEEGLLYYKADTHWNFLGAYYGYRIIMDTVKKDFPDVPLYTAEKYETEQYEKSDMYYLAPEFVKDDKEHYKVPVIGKNFALASDKWFINPSGKYSAVVLRDSFSNALMRYFYFSFRYTGGNWGMILTREKYDAIRAGKVNVVILEHVERSLPLAMYLLEEFMKSKEGEM